MIREIIPISVDNIRNAVNQFSPIVIVRERHCAISIGQVPQIYPQWVRPVLFVKPQIDEFIGERILVFLDHVESDDTPFTLFLSEDGDGSRVYSIAKFIKSVLPKAILQKNLMVERNDEPTFSRLLAKMYGRKLAETLAKNAKAANG